MKHKPWVGAILNLFLPGSGYLYSSQRLFLGVTLTLFYLSIYYTAFTGPVVSNEPLAKIEILMTFIFFALNIAYSYDAYQEIISSKSNQANNIINEQ